MNFALVFVLVIVLVVLVGIFSRRSATPAAPAFLKVADDAVDMEAVESSLHINGVEDLAIAGAVGGPSHA